MDATSGVTLKDCTYFRLLQMPIFYRCRYFTDTSGIYTNLPMSALLCSLHFTSCFTMCAVLLINLVDVAIARHTNNIYFSHTPIVLVNALASFFHCPWLSYVHDHWIRIVLCSVLYTHVMYCFFHLWQGGGECHC